MNKWMFFALLLILSACDPAKKATKEDTTTDNKAMVEATTKCKIEGTVKDYSGLDGCKWMIETKDGKKYLPMKVANENFTFIDGQEILFGYTEIKDGVSACMASNKIIEVTCIKSTGNVKPYVKDCVNTDDPTAVKWMAEVIRAEKPDRITKYNFRDGWAYMIFTKENRYLFDCQGTKLCPNEEGNTRDCLARYLPIIKNAKVIYPSIGPGNE